MDPSLSNMETPLPSILQPTPIPTSAAAAAAATAAIPAVVKAEIGVQPFESSPRALASDAGGNAEPLPAVPGAKLRLMCSYGGHIMPRPHDKALTYVGGETRLVVVDRHSSLSSLRSRLSRMLLNGREFTLKYQLPNEDLDSLVSITTDEDLENMVEEYDRVTSSAAGAASQRLRLFLFANKLETAATMGSLIDGAKSETWFVDALNQSGLLPRGLSDSAAVDNCLLNLDDASTGEAAEMQTLETNVGGENNKQADSVANGAIPHHEIHLSSMPDSPMLENASSSYGSSSSTPSMANLPPIRVRVSEEQRIEEQFAQMNFSNGHIQRHLEDGVGLVVARPLVMPPAAMTDAVAAAAINNTVPDGAGGGGQVPPDDDRSDPNLPTGYRKPPLPLQQVAVPPRAGGGYGLPSPDSVASDSSISSATSFSKPVYYHVHDQAQAPSRGPGTQPETTSVQTPNAPVQPVTYAAVDQHQPPVQQPYMHHGVQYIPHPSQYIPVYPHQQQNYPVYLMSVPQSQPYVSAGTPPLYPNSKPATTQKPEAAQNMYRAGAPPNPQLLQLQQQQPQPQQQYVSYSAVPHHAANANYNGYEYSNPPNEPMYYHAQPPVAAAAIPLASQYQSMTPAAVAAALADASKQMALDSNKQHITAASASASQPQ